MSDPEPAPLPAPPWQRHPPERTRRRGREPITREAIVETALRLLDRDGLDELSMRRLADELDTGPASLYWHVGSKDGLLELIFDRVIGEVEMPEARARTLAGAAEGGGTRRTGDDPPPPRHRPHLDRPDPNGPKRTSCLRGPVRDPPGRRRPGPARGHSAPPAVRDHQRLHARRDNRARRRDRAPLDEQAATAARDYVAALPVDQFPNLLAVAEHFGYADNDQSFELLIDLFVDGLAQRVNAGPIQG